METGRFEELTENSTVLDVCHHLLDEPIFQTSQICERYGSEEEEVRKYDVYSVTCASGKKILKKASSREVHNYEKYLSKGEFYVPKYFGQYTSKSDTWILLEALEGRDLRDMTNQLAVSTADSISEIQNYFWGCSDSERFQAYMDRIGRRYQFIKGEPIISDAYKIFLNRQRECPRTMSNGDFLEFNVIERNGRVYIIDWGFGGIMPYSLDIARFIAHGTEDRATFPFYMNKEQKGLFVRHVYNKLIQKPSYERFVMDIKLAVLNEYVEFVEADEDEGNWYFQHALELAEKIVRM